MRKDVLISMALIATYFFLYISSQQKAPTVGNKVSINIRV